MVGRALSLLPQLEKQLLLSKFTKLVIACAFAAFLVINRDHRNFFELHSCYFRYILTILASDLGTPSLTSKAIVEVLVDDVNDNGPQFTRLYSATIRENAVVGEFVVLVSQNFLIKFLNLSYYEDFET